MDDDSDSICPWKENRNSGYAEKLEKYKSSYNALNTKL